MTGTYCIAQHLVIAYNGKESGKRKNIYIHIYYESFCCTPETLQINYTSIKTKKWTPRVSTLMPSHIVYAKILDCLSPKVFFSISSHFTYPHCLVKALFVSYLDYFNYP